MRKQVCTYILTHMFKQHMWHNADGTLKICHHSDYAILSLSLSLSLSPLPPLSLQQAQAEQEEEFISNTLLKKIHSLKKEKEALAMNYEQEEEFLTNDLSRKLAQVCTCM